MTDKTWTKIEVRYADDLDGPMFTHIFPTAETHHHLSPEPLFNGACWCQGSYDMCIPAYIHNESPMQ